MSNDGINGMIDVSHLPYNFFVCEGLNLIGENVYVVPKGSANSHLFMMASDYCIAKAGWSSISEFIIAHKHMALIQRDEVSEDSDYIELLVKENLAIKIDISEIKTVGEVIEKMKRFKWSESKYSDDTSRICMEILTG